MSVGAIIAIVLGALLLIFLTTILCLMPRKAYFTAMFSGCYIGLFKSIGMKLRKVNITDIVFAYISSKKAHLGIKINELELVSTSGGNPIKVIEGIIAAQNAKIKMDFEFAKSIDIAGYDCLEVVRQCINPKVIELPLISAVAQDNIEINVKISLTLQVVIEKFLTGVVEETISSRAVEAVVTKIANTPKAQQLVSKPQFLDAAIFEAEIDSDAKYSLVSADVIHIDVGQNRNLIAEKEQIEKENLITANQLEHRRLIAVAVEQEMKAKAEEMRAKVIATEAEVPKAVVEAIKAGKMKDVVDYYKLQNLQADTEMRRHLAGKKEKPSEE